MKKLLILFLFPVSSYAQTFIGLSLGSGNSYADIKDYNYYSYSLYDRYRNFPVSIFAGRYLNPAGSISIHAEINFMKQGYKQVNTPFVNHGFYRSTSNFVFSNLSAPLMVSFSSMDKFAGIFFSVGGGPVFAVKAEEVYSDTSAYYSSSPWSTLSTSSHSGVRTVENNNKTGLILIVHTGFQVKFKTRYMLALGVKGQYGIVKIYKENTQPESGNGYLGAFSANMSFYYLFVRRSKNK